MAHARKLTPETLALIKSAPMPSDVERLLSHVTALEEELKGCKDIQGVYYATMTSLEKKARALEEELKAAQDKMLAQVSVMKQHGVNEVNDFRAQLVEAVSGVPTASLGSGNERVDRNVELYRNSVIQLIQTFEARLDNPITAAGDGRFCRHHDDDPAHGPECYDLQTFEPGEVK